MGKSVGVRLGVAAVVIIGVMGYKAFFVDSDEVVRFNDRLVDMIGRYDAKFTQFGSYVEAYSNGDKVDVAQMTATNERLAKSVKSDRDVLKFMTVPDDEVCKEFHAACAAYVENSVKFLEANGKIIDHVSEHNPAGEGDSEVVNALLAEPIADDERLFDAVTMCQRKMAERFDFKLE